MAYKKLSEATLVESVVEETNVLVEENDEIKRVSASLFKPDYSEIINAPISEDITEEVNVLIEENGEIKRVPASMFRQSGGGNEGPIIIEDYEETPENAIMLKEMFDNGRNLYHRDHNNTLNLIIAVREEYDDATSSNSIVFMSLSSSDITDHWWSIE